MQKIKVVGVGPGGDSFLTPEANKALQEAATLIGGRRHLKTFAGKGKETLEIKSNFGEVLELIRKRRESGVAVLASGDPGLYGILKFLLKHFTPADIEVVPGISSVQLAFARLSMPWDGAVLLSAHGRPPEKVAEIAGSVETAAVLTGNDNPPEKIFKLVRGLSPGKRFYLCFDLSLPGEAMAVVNPGDEYPSEYIGRHNCVMVIVDG